MQPPSQRTLASTKATARQQQQGVQGDSASQGQGGILKSLSERSGPKKDGGIAVSDSRSRGHGAAAARNIAGGGWPTSIPFRPSPEPPRSDSPRTRQATDIPASWKERELVFTEEEGQGQLQVQLNQGIELRSKITQHSNFLGNRVYGAVNKVFSGTYETQPACLLVVRFNFRGNRGWFRLRKATITICFNNHPNPSLPNNSRTHPIVRVFSPRLIYGLQTGEEKETHWELGARCATAGPLQTGLEASLGGASRVSLDHALEIAGMDEPEFDKQHSNKVVFEVDENSKQSQGVPRELYFGVMVTHDNKGAIQADITTSIGDRTAWPWSRDDPIILAPRRTFGQDLASLPQDFKSWTDDHWKTAVPYLEERIHVVQGGAR